MAIEQVRGWQVDGSTLVLSLEGEFFKEILQKNIHFLLQEIQRWGVGIRGIEIVVKSVQEAPLERWEDQRAAWLDIFKGQVKDPALVSGWLEDGDE